MPTTEKIFHQMLLINKELAYESLFFTINNYLLPLLYFQRLLKNNYTSICNVD